MSRKRYISTDISTDAKVAELSSHGFLAPLIYTWSIPHMDDWGRISGDAREFKMQVCPGLDITIRDVEEAINQVVSIGLWIRYNVNGKWCISISKPETWFKHQSYINKSKRDDDTGSNYPSSDKQQETPKNAEERQETAVMTEIEQETAKIAASFSSSVSLSSSSSPLKEKHNTLSVYTSNTFLQDALKSFVEFRKKIKKPMTEKAISLLVGNLDKLASTDNEKIEILEQSILNGWQGVFELKKVSGGVSNGPKQYASYRNGGNKHAVNGGSIEDPNAGIDFGF